MRKLLMIVAALALVAAACGDDDDAAESTAVAPATEAPATEAPATEAPATEAPATEAPEGGLAAAASDLGEILVDAEGRTLYLFTPDVDGVSVCYGDCESAWPPFYEEALGTPANGIDGSLLGTAPRDDGTVQVTYGGWPLYYFAGDAAPGDTNGQGVNDVWYVLGADGQGIGVPGGGLSSSSSDLGEILVDGEGRTLYLFTVDADGVSACYDGCEQAWPPFYRDALGAIGEGIDADLIGTAERTDGTVQVTYGGWPLYYFANDSAPGDTNGQGVNDVWFVVDAAGQAIGN